MTDFMSSQAILDVEAERKRQIDVEGWTHDLDDQYRAGELCGAAVAYAMATAEFLATGKVAGREPHPLFRFDPRWWKPSTARRNLVKAAALIVAEIERLDRPEAP